MHRFYVPQCSPPVIVLSGSEAHHALHVLRLRRGDSAVVLDGQGTQYACELDYPEKHEVRLHVKNSHTAPPPACKITLIQALPKGKLIEDVIQKAVELGAWAVVPLISHRVVRQVEPKDALRAQHKWQQVAIEAIKQCGSLWLPIVELPGHLSDYLSTRPTFELSLVGALQNDRKHPRDYFSAFQKAHGRRPQTASIWIGPEGDFTQPELELITASGALPITMGNLVLRTDTAAIYGLSILNYELQAPKLQI